MILTLHMRPERVYSGADIVEVSGWVSASNGESPVLSVLLDPALPLAAELHPPPLRAQATLVADDGETFEGIVQAVRLGPAPELTLEL